MSEARAPSGYALQRVVSLALQTIEALRTDHGQIIETDTDLLDALAGEGVDVEHVLRRWVRSALDDKADAAAADARLDDLKARRDRFRRHEESKRATILAMMEAIGLTKFRDPEFSLSISAGRPKVLITDEMALPDELVITTRAPDKTAIKQALETWNDVPGAVLSQSPPTLTIRSR